MRPADKPVLNDGQLVTLRDIPEVVRGAREGAGLSHEQAADHLGVSKARLIQAESQPYRGRFKLRRLLLEQLTGFTLEGPFYRVRRK